MTRNLWQDGIDAPPLTAPRPALDGSRPALDGDTDVAIVGAGFTGLWTAFYLRQFAPGLRVLVIEAAHAGYGASGRNGGWCSAELPAGLATLAARYGRAAAVAMQQAARDAVDEVGKVIADEAIDCGWSKDGSLRLARNTAQRGRLETLLREERDFGFEDGWRLADPADLAVPRLRAAAFTPHCAVVQPARLARGLAAAAVRHGAEIVEGTRATELTPSAVRGFELPSAAGEEMLDAARDVPAGIAKSLVATAALYGLPVLGILLVLPVSEVSGLAGFPEAVRQAMTVFGGTVTTRGAQVSTTLTGLGTVMGWLMGALIAIVAFTSGPSPPGSARRCALTCCPAWSRPGCSWRRSRSPAATCSSSSRSR